MTPRQLLDRLADLLPGFRAHWDGPHNYSLRDDGSFTLHSVFWQLTDYFREHHAALPADRVAALGAFVTECMAPDDDGPLDNAAATCFVENIAGEGYDLALAPYLTGPARRYWLAWGGQDAEPGATADGGVM